MKKRRAPPIIAMQFDEEFYRILDHWTKGNCKDKRIDYLVH